MSAHFHTRAINIVFSKLCSMKVPPVWLLLLFIAMCSHMSSAFALTVFPVRLELNTGKTALSLVVTNDTVAEVSVQVMAKTWKQRNRAGETPEDILENTADFTIFPAVLQLKPQQKQTVRLRFNGKADARNELSYRLLVEELAVNLKPGVLNLFQRISIPIFVQAASQEYAPLLWQVESKSGSAPVLLLDNTEGRKHYRVTSLAFSTPGDGVSPSAPEKTIQLFQYMLPGATARLTLKEAPPPNWSGATLTTDAGILQLSPANK